jgi:hypothetical protein
MLFTLGLFIFTAGGILFLLSFILLTSCIPDTFETLITIIGYTSISLMIIGVCSIGIDMLTYLGIL